MDDCIFCKIAAGEMSSDKVYEDNDFYAFRDINPAAPTHILLIPKKHIARITDATAEHAELLGRMLLIATEIAQSEGVAAEGVRFVLNCNEGAGQSVWHIHLHIIGGRALSWPPG